MKVFKVLLLPVLMCVALSGVYAQCCPPKAAACEAKPGLINPAKDVFFWESNADGSSSLRYNWNKPATIYSLSVENGKNYMPGREAMILNIPGRSKGHVNFTSTSVVKSLPEYMVPAGTVMPGAVLLTAELIDLMHDSVDETGGIKKNGLPGWSVMCRGLWESTGLYDIIRQSSADFSHTWSLGIGRVIMISVGILLLFLAIVKGFEPLLLLPMSPLTVTV